MLHLFTCHRRIIPRLAELLFHFLHIFNLDIFYMILSQKQVPCEHNSFILILLKLHRCLNHGLKICMCFLQNLEITFILFFSHF